ncbi:DUF1772 domain-containing protein [Desertihabitans brevis]|uniref:DUF1772 domain-containing protein n=1 Tax=Desertihabitans brevis TaxID=2268447 RepID=A0A367YSE3_9ACTN|nr:anthrone oxygenase family protein [Desertihabitans brevis]RCK68479.1 DUF1772 domain-containing protein [Desertihabitans brevis]
MLWELLVLLTAVAAALVGGVFFAFSGFVMAGLARTPDEVGAAAMAGINVTAVRPPLMLALFGTALACLVLLVRGVLDGSGWLVAGALVHLAGCVVVTAAGNVPLNNRLQAAVGSGTDVAATWQHYLRRWTALNHVRSVAGVAAAVLLLVPTL